MKIIINESKMSIEYISSVIEDCDTNGLMAIADDAGGEIYIFDPKSNLYATSKSLMEADATVDDIIKVEELKNEVMLPAIGDKFKEFAVKWNDLEKKSEDDEVYKTKKCAPIHGNFTESINNEIENDKRVRNIMRMIDKYADMYLDGMTGEKSMDMELHRLHADIRYKIEELIEKCEPIHETFTESEIENDVVEGIPNWAAYYIGYGEVTDDMTSEDVKMVDDYLRKLDNDGIRLIAPIEGTENEFNPHPAFGDACDTTDWSCEID